MNRKPGKKIVVVITICIAMIAAQTFAQKEDHDDAPKNLQVLPKNLSQGDIHKIMREYATSLGVRCGFCHASEAAGDKPRLDFASDAKPEKTIARGMIKMVDSINNMLDHIGNNHLDHITCVSCHHGMTKPIVSVDSLVKKGN